jgi:hypothetical protein
VYVRIATTVWFGNNVVGKVSEFEKQGGREVGLD